jgi:hypothetical protein
METVYLAFVQTIVSGIALLIITHYIKTNSENAAKIIDVEKKIVQKELSDMSIKFVSIEQKQDKLDMGLQSVKEKLTLVGQKQDDAQVRMTELISTVENIRRDVNFGKVVRK